MIKKKRNINGCTNIDGVISNLKFPAESCKKNLVKVRTLKWQK
jgi:hypothetical protein